MPIWAPINPEFPAKSRYAKYHAVRIMKAIKAGEDPNASNPPSEDVAPQSPVPGLEETASSANGYKPPTVESVPESRIPSRPGSIVQPSPFVPATPLAPTDPFQNVTAASEADDASRSASVGGGYFPSVPGATSDDTEARAPTANPASFNRPFIPTPGNIASPTDFYNQSQSSTPAPVPAPIPAPMSHPVPSAIPQSQPLPPVQSLPPGSYRTDDDSVTLATKHAKWAISALNFEDVNTAVKELRLALNSLGAQ